MHRPSSLRTFAHCGSAAAIALGLASCAGSLGEARPCPEAACAEGRSCVAGRCRPVEGPTSPVDGQRVVLAPVELAVVSARGGGGGDDLPDTVALGRAAGGTVVLLLRFEATWRDDAEVSSAFLVLDTLEATPPASERVRFEMARITEPWEPGAVSLGRQPRLAVPLQAGSARARPAASMRVDVTPLVRGWSRRAEDDHGIALLASGDDPIGAVISTGPTHGRGPRLEVIVK